MGLVGWADPRARELVGRFEAVRQEAMDARLVAQREALMRATRRFGALEVRSARLRCPKDRPQRLCEVRLEVTNLGPDPVELTSLSWVEKRIAIDARGRRFALRLLPSADVPDRLARGAHFAIVSDLVAAPSTDPSRPCS